MSHKTLKVKVSGLHCKACELLSEEKLSALPGVKAVRVSHSRGQAEIDYEGQSPSLESINSSLHKLGYSLDGEIGKETGIGIQKKWRELGIALLITSLLALIFKLSGWLDIQTNSNAETLSLGGVLIIGLIAGISTCIALVGGIVMALAADYAKRHPEASRSRKFLPHLYFNLGRILGFFLLGGLLGAIGAVIKISTLTSTWLSLIIGLIIIVLGLQVLDIFPALNRFSFTLPKSIKKIIPVNTQGRRYRPAGAILAGALSFFIPCGFTQSMQIYALSSGSFFSGAVIMAIFALGTAPGFLSLGGLVSLIKGKHRSLFLKTAGLIVIAFGIFNFYNAYRVLNLHLQAGPQAQGVNTENQEVQIIKMEQNGRGYTPNYFQVRAGQPVRWLINSSVPYSCASSLVVPSLKISRQLQKGENVIEFTPSQPGIIKFTCSMGMYSGSIEVLAAEATPEPAKTTIENEEKFPVCNVNGCK